MAQYGENHPRRRWWRPDPFTFAQWFWERVANNSTAILTFLTGAGLLGAGGELPAFLAGWSWRGYVFLALAGGIMALTVLALGTRIGLWRQLRQVREKVYKEPGRLNPTQRKFDHETIDPRHLVLPGMNRIVRKDFWDCDIVGPVNVALRNQFPFNEPEYFDCEMVVLGGAAECHSRVRMPFHPMQVLSSDVLRLASKLYPLNGRPSRAKGHIIGAAAAGRSEGR
jgi:hypothetical protein